MMKSVRRVPRSLLLLAALACMALSLVVVWLHVNGISDGARIGPNEPFGEPAWQSDGVIATPLEDIPGDLRAHDVIVAVDGISLAYWADNLLQPGLSRPEWRIGQTVTYTVLRDGLRVDIPIRLRPYPIGAVLANAGTLPFVALVSLLGSTYLFWQRRAEPAVLLLLAWSICLCAAVTSVLVGLQMSDIVGGTGFWLYKAATFGTAMLAVIVFANFALIFPRPHPPFVQRTTARWLFSLAPLVVYLGYLALARLQASSTLSWINLWSATLPLPALIYMALTLTSLITGYFWNAANPVARQQTRLVVFSIVIMGGGMLIFGALPRILLGRTLLDRNLLALFPLMIPIAIFAAILRDHLFDLDLLVHRALVYTILTTLIVGGYIAAVAASGLLLQSRGNLVVSLLATGLIAVLFQPLRQRVQGAVNRLMYGERDNPYVVLSRLGKRLEAALTPDAVLPTIVETVAYALKLPYAGIALKVGDDYQLAAAYGLPRGEPMRVNLTYQGESIGHLLLAERTPGEAFAPADRRLLDDLAHQAGIAVHVVRLTAELQRSRERLVTARDEERRRLRRDLHDGLGPALAGLALKLDAARNRLETDPSVVATLLMEGKSQSQAVIAEVRRLVYDLRPPSLDELGLTGALWEQVVQYDGLNNLIVGIDAPDQLPSLPAAVEVAAYRIALEAFNNVIRHAGAKTCRIRLILSDALYLQVDDDGRGLPSSHRVGVGLTSMRERAEELGGTCVIEASGTGGTSVKVRLPLLKE